MALVVYKGQLVTPMELRMIIEREKAEEEARKKREEERKKKREKIPKRPTTPMELKTKTEYEKARKEAEAKKIRKEREEKPVGPPKQITYGLKLDFEPYPMPTERPKTPSYVEDIWLKYEETMGIPSAYMRVKASETLLKAVEAKTEGRGLEAGVYFSTYMIQRMGAGIYEGITIPVRPLALAETLGSTIKLVDPKFRKEVVKAISEDPAGFTAEVTGGFLGGYILGRSLQYVKGKYRAYQQARFERKYPIEEFLPYEKEYVTPQITQETDFRSLVTDERAKPVIWEYRGDKRPRIPIDQRLPLKEYPDPSKVELMGGKAIIDLVSLDEVSRARTVIEPAWIPGLRISDIGPTISKAIPSKTPYISGIIGAIRSIKEVGREKTEALLMPKPREETKLSLKPVEWAERKLGEPTLPEYIVGPTPIEEEIQPTLPRYIQPPISIQRTKTRLKTDKKQKTILEAPMPIIQTFPTYPEPRQIKEIKPSKYRMRIKKVKEIGFLDLFKVGEIREYKVKSPKELLKGL